MTDKSNADDTTDRIPYNWMNSGSFLYHGTDSDFVTHSEISYFKYVLLRIYLYIYTCVQVKGAGSN